VASGNTAERTGLLRCWVLRLMAPEGTSTAVGSSCPAEGLADSHANFRDPFEPMDLSLTFWLHWAFSSFAAKRSDSRFVQDFVYRD